MRLLLFDTETTGLPKNIKGPATAGPDNWPHLVSIGWIVIENDKVITEDHRVIKPVNWIIPSESTAIHGITHENAARFGSDLNYVMDEFLSTKCDMWIAHNMNFDWNVIVNTLQWDLKRSVPNDLILFCTMVASKNICRISSQYHNGYKSPKLSELYTHVMKKEPDSTWLHNALGDTRLLKDIVLNCKEIRDLIGLKLTRVDNTSNELPKSTTRTLHLNLAETD